MSPQEQSAVNQLESATSDEQPQIAEDSTGTDAASDFELGPELELVSENVAAQQGAKLTQPTNVKALSSTKSVEVSTERNTDSTKRVYLYVYKEDPQTTENLTELGSGYMGTGRPRIVAKLHEPLVEGQVIYLVLKQADREGRNWVFNGVESDPLAVTVAQSMADANTITAPEEEFWVEDKFTFSPEEIDEILNAFKNANPDIKDKIKSVDPSWNGSDPVAKVKVIYSDGSISSEVDVKIHLITEDSATPVIDKPFIVTQDKITGTIPTEDGKPLPDGTKVGIVTEFKGDDLKNFGGRKCKVTKNSNERLADVDVKSGKFSLENVDLRLPWSKSEYAAIGIVVKSPRKFATCITIVPEHPTPKKTPVRDPRKLTTEDKSAIDKAIRTAYTAKSGKSKLPDGTGDLAGNDAFIDFYPDGHVDIINPRDTVYTWENGKAQFATNEDGTHKLKDKDAAQVRRIPIEELITNIKPKSPSIKVDYKAGTVTITPPAYTSPGDDTDLASYTISYGNKTITLTRTVSDEGTSTWSSKDGQVDPSTGVVTLQIADLPVGATITAVATDSGGLVPEEQPLSSDEVSEKLQTATVSYDPNGGSGAMDDATLNKGGKYKILPNQFTAPEGKEFAGWKIGETTHAAGYEAVVNADTTVVAQWKPVPVKVTTTVEVPTTVRESTTVTVPTTVKEPTTVEVPTTVKEPTTVTMPTTVKESTTVTVPTTVKESTTVTVPTTVKESTTVKVPTTVKEPTTVTVPTTVKESTTVTVPTTVKESTTVTVPTTVKEPTTVEVPTTVTVPTTVEVPTTVTVPTTVKEPTTVKVPTTVKEPTTVKVPTTVKEPTTVEVPTTVKEPTTVEVPTTVKEPTTVTVPTTVKESTTVKVPTTVKEPTTVTVPTTVKEPTTVTVPTTVKETTTVKVTKTVEPSATTDPNKPGDPNSPAEPSETTTPTGPNKPNQPGDKPSQTSTPTEPDANGSSEKAKRCAANAFAVNSPLLWLLPIGLLVGIGYGVNEAFGPQIRPAGAEMNARLQELMPEHSWVGELQAKADAVNRQFASYSEQLRPLGIALGAIAAVSMLGVLIAQACEEDGFNNGLTLLSSSKNDTAAEDSGSSEQK